MRIKIKKNKFKLLSILIFFCIFFSFFNLVFCKEEKKIELEDLNNLNDCKNNQNCFINGKKITYDKDKNIWIYNGNHYKFNDRKMYETDRYHISHISEIFYVETEIEVNLFKNTNVKKPSSSTKKLNQMKELNEKSQIINQLVKKIKEEEKISNKQIGEYIKKINNVEFTKQILEDDLSKLNKAKESLKKCNNENCKKTGKENLENLKNNILIKCGDKKSCLEYAGSNLFKSDKVFSSNMLEVIQGTNCEGGFGFNYMWCILTSKETIDGLAQKHVNKILNDAKNENKKIKEEFIIYNEKEEKKKVQCKNNNNEAISYDDCLQEIEDFCQSSENKNCKTNLINQLDKNSYLDTTNYNKNLIEKVLTEMDLNNEELSECEKGNSKKCIKEIEKLDICKNNNNPTKCNILKDSIKSALDKQIIENPSNSLSAWMLLNVDDKAAKNAVEYFDAEKNLLKQWGFDYIGKDIETTICEAEFGGYLDDSDDYLGGSTIYGCTQDDLETDYNTDYKQTCKEVIGDLRAQMSQILPNNHSTLVYSYYLKFPKNIKARYAIGISYKDLKGNKNKTLIEGPIYINDTIEDNENIKRVFRQIDLNFTKEIDLNSTKIGLIAYLGHEIDAQKYLNINMPILIATPTSYDGPDNSDGNQRANLEDDSSSNSNSQNTLENHDLAEIQI